MGMSKSVQTDAKCFDLAIKTLVQKEAAVILLEDDLANSVDVWMSRYWLSYLTESKRYGIFLTGDSSDGKSSTIVIVCPEYCIAVTSNQLYLSTTLVQQLAVAEDDIYDRLTNVILGLLAVTGHVDRLHHGLLADPNIMPHELSEGLDEILFHLARSARVR